MPFRPHPTVSGGVKKQNWVRPWHDDNVRGRGAEVPILPTQLSRIWEVKFYPLRHCRGIKAVQQLLWRGFGLRNMVISKGSREGMML